MCSSGNKGETAPDEREREYRNGVPIGTNDQVMMETSAEHQLVPSLKLMR